MLTTIIFDIGNVLVDFCWEPYFKSFGFSEEIFGRLVAATVRTPDWAELDRGVLTEEEVIQRFVRRAPDLEAEIRRVFGNLNGILRVKEDTVSWLQSLKKEGYRVLVLSNFPEKMLKDCAENMVFLKETDGGILSYQEKLIKPMPAIYWTLLDRYGLKAEECVFIDDMPDNVEAAKRLGIHGIVFESREQVEKELAGLKK